jgi:hypothetical protein
MSPDPLDELESHLRDEVENGIAAGMEEARAFTAATLLLGSPTELRNEFHNLQPEPITMKHKILLALGIFMLFAFDLGLILPGVAKMKEHGAFATADLLAFGAGLVIFVAALAWGAFAGIKHLQRPRA